jgi:hypothetical protein
MKINKLLIKKQLKNILINTKAKNKNELIDSIQIFLYLKKCTLNNDKIYLGTKYICQLKYKTNNDYIIIVAIK